MYVVEYSTHRRVNYDGPLRERPSPPLLHRHINMSSSSDSSVRFDKLVLAAVAVYVSISVLKYNTPANRRTNPSKWWIWPRAVIADQSQNIAQEKSSLLSDNNKKTSKLITSPNKDSIELHGRVLEG